MAAFLDTNVLLYVFSADAAKADRAEALLAQRGCISVQVLNEMASVASRKLGMDWDEIGEALGVICSLCEVAALTVEVHELGLSLAARYRLSIYDAMIAAAALLAGCDTLYSEDMHDGLCLEGRLTVVNPFAARSPAPPMG